jgi:uncharacterized protein with FMN-binding domain
MGSRIERREKMKKALVGIAAASLLLLTACGNSSGTYKAGTYTATAAGYGGDVTVEVKFDRDSILSVTVTEQNETAGIGDRAVEELPDQIVQAQTWKVDAVSTATVTSDAVKTAVRDCMEQAAGK